jgi:DNA mismatch endonuclease (patch repair protein)
MSTVKATGNASTEQRVERELLGVGLTGWIKHAKELPGKPDFFFEDSKTALFVDGCFWHGCPTCRRRIPTSRREFWRKKINDNCMRDSRVRRRYDCWDFTRLEYGNTSYGNQLG